MKTILIINLVLMLIIIFYLLYRDFLYRLKFSFERTFWMKKIIGINVMWWDKDLICGTGKTFGKCRYDSNKDYSDYLKLKNNTQ